MNLVSFSPDANNICYASNIYSYNLSLAHDCELNFVDVSKAA
jgi:hypothetical protein